MFDGTNADDVNDYRPGMKALKELGVISPLKACDMGKKAGAITIVRGEIKKSAGKILIATGGTSDIPVAEEAAITEEFFGNTVYRLYDVGVAGMEGALASVIGVFPLPAPATLEILKNVPVYYTDINFEMVTPTGAAIAKGLANEYEDCRAASEQYGRPITDIYNEAISKARGKLTANSANL